MIFGDSYIEGYTLLNEVGNYNSRYADKVYVAAGNDVVLSAKGGASTGTLLNNWLAWEISKYSPTYVVLAIGYNDSDSAVWKANMDTLISLVEARGATPVLVVQPPRFQVE